MAETESMGTLEKVDSAIAGMSSSPVDDRKMRHRRTSSSASGVFKLSDLEKEKKEITIAPETQKLGWKMNTSPNTVEDREHLKKLLVQPPVNKVDLHFPLGLEVTARNMKGVTIKDALEAIHKQFKKKQDDEIELPYLAGFEWDKEDSWTRLIVHQKKDSGIQAGGKKKKGKKDEEAA